jgi:hypothetical protein
LTEKAVLIDASKGRSGLLSAMYRKPRFLEELHAIREEMSRECDYDVDLFAEMVRSGKRPGYNSEPGYDSERDARTAERANADRRSSGRESQPEESRLGGRISNIPGVTPPERPSNPSEDNNQSNRRSDLGDD